VKKLKTFRGDTHPQDQRKEKHIAGNYDVFYFYSMPKKKTHYLEDELLRKKRGDKRDKWGGVGLRIPQERPKGEQSHSGV